jgi:hypothetical protein
VRHQTLPGHTEIANRHPNAELSLGLAAISPALGNPYSFVIRDASRILEETIKYAAVAKQYLPRYYEYSRA